MAEERIYTIIVKQQRIEVSEEIYSAYHQAREKERYQMKKIKHTQLSLDRMNEEGVSVESKIVGMEDLSDAMVKKEELLLLKTAVNQLSTEERQLVEQLFYLEKSEREIAESIGISQQAVSVRKKKMLKHLKKLLEKNK